MSEQLFSRSAMITFEAPKKDGKSYEGLRIQFEVEKNEDSTPNTAKISVFNLTDDTRSYIQLKNTVCKLSVGYQGMLARPLYSNLFTGAITKIKTKKDTGNVVTSFESADGILQYTGARIGKSYAPGAQAKQVFSDLANELGLGKVDADKAGLTKKNGQFIRGYSMSGLVRDELDKLCARTNTTWSIQDQQLVIRVKDTPTEKEVLLLTHDTGLIGIPNKGEMGEIEFEALLNPKITPGQRVQIDSKGIKGIFRVAKVKYKGDSRSGDWKCECEAKK